MPEPEHMSRTLEEGGWEVGGWDERFESWRRRRGGEGRAAVRSEATNIRFLVSSPHL